MKKLKRILLSLLAVTALVSVCLAPRASASMSGIFGVTGSGSNRPGSAQWQLSEISTTQQQESSQQENTQQSMSGVFGVTGSGSNRPGSVQWQLSDSSSTQQQESSQQESSQQESGQQESSQVENIQQAVKDALSSADSGQMENVVKNQLRTLVTEIAAWMKQLDSTTPHYEIENRVVQTLKQSGTAVFDEMSLRKTIRQILTEAYPDAYTPNSHPDDRKRDDLLDEKLRQLVSQTIKQMEKENFSAKKETIAEGLIIKIKENGTLIIDEAALRRQILRLIEEEYPSGRDSGYGNNNSTGEDDDEGFEEFPANQPLYDGYTIGSYELKNFSSNNGKEIILESVVEVSEYSVSIRCKSVVQDADIKNFTVRCLDTGKYISVDTISCDGNNIKIMKSLMSKNRFTAGHMYEVSNGRSSVRFRVNTEVEEEYSEGVYAYDFLSEDRFVMEKIDWADAKSLCIQCKSDVWNANVSDYSIRCINTDKSLPIGVFFWSNQKIYIELDSDSFTPGNTYEIRNGWSSLRFTVRTEEDSLHFDTIKTISYVEKSSGLSQNSVISGSPNTAFGDKIIPPRGIPNLRGSNDSVFEMTLTGTQFNIPTFELPSSQKKPGGLHSITYEDGVLKVGTTVEPTDSVKQAIQREGTEDTDWYIDWYIFKMPDQPVSVDAIMDGSRTITVVSRGKTVATYQFRPGDDLSNFDASGDLEMPAPEEHLKLAGWQWKREGSDRWMEKPSVMPDENLVLTSLWWPEEYSVTCNGEKTWVPFGHDLYPPEVETPEGMIFNHWEWRKEGSTEVIDKPYTMPACNLIATPFWTPRAYCLTVNGAATQVLYGTALAEPAAPEAPEGHSFGGWKWTVGGAEASKPDTMPAADVTATPIWTANTYTLTINGSSSPVAYGTPLTEPSAPTAPEGHSFGGWKWTVGGTETAMPATMPAADVTAEPIWTVNTYTLTVNGESSPVAYGTALTEPAAPTAPEGHSFGGWKWTVGGTETAMPATMPAADVTAEPIWTVNTYTLTVNGESSPVAYGTALTEPAAPTAPEGHSFGGWKWTVGGTETAMPATMPAADVTATANWTVITPPEPEKPEEPEEPEEPEDVTYYIVTFEWPDGGHVEYEYEAGEEIAIPDVTLPEGYWWNWSDKWIMPGHNITITAVRVEL